MAWATANSRRMLSITLGTNPAFTLPALNFGGTPAGIDAVLVGDSGVLPIINTGIAHKKAGIGQIGAGITTAPMRCFDDAIAALAATLRPAASDGSLAIRRSSRSAATRWSPTRSTTRSPSSTARYAGPCRISSR